MTDYYIPLNPKLKLKAIINKQEMQIRVLRKQLSILKLKVTKIRKIL